METENSKKMPVFWIIIGVVIFMVIVLCVIIGFKVGFLKTFLIGLVILWVLAIFGLVVWAVIWLLGKQRSDMIHLMKQRVLQSCKLFRPPYSQEVWIWGDVKNSIPSRMIGYCQGVCKIRTKPSYKKKIEENKYGVPVEVLEEKAPAEDLFLLAFNKGSGFPLSLFDEAKIFMGKREDFSDFDGSRIYLYGLLAPEVYGVYTIAKYWDRTFVIDEPVKETIYRYVIQDFLKEIKNITDDALSISPEHQKKLERSNMESVTGKDGSK